MTNKELLAVIAAEEVGKKIECRLIGAGPADWTLKKHSHWATSSFDYRIAPEPAPKQGRAVRCFKEGMALFRQNPEWAFRQGYSGDIVRSDTPEAALREAGLMEGEGECMSD